MAQSVFGELHSLLENLCALYDQIAECMKKEREGLIRFSFDELKQINLKKEDLCREVHKYEFIRKDLLEDLQFKYQIREDPVTIASLTVRMPEEWREKIQKTSERLQQKMKMCVELYERNKSFMEHSMHNMKLLQDNYQKLLGIESATYSKEGKVTSYSGGIVRKKV